MPDQTPLPVLLRDLRRRWRLAGAITLAVLAGAVLYAGSLPNTYASSAVVSFAPKPNTNAAADTVRVVLPKYVAYVTARPTVNRVARRLGESSAKLAAAVDASVAADSGNLTISVELGSAQRAARAANAMSGDLLDFASDDKLLDAELVADALPSSAPSGPPRRLLEIAALLVGALAGASVALLVERGRPRVRSWRDVGVVTGYTVVGRVPSTRAMREAPDEALTDPAVGAAMRTLRTNLERASREQPTRVLAVTSSTPGEGKTTIAGALAVSLARLDSQVLLIDGDLRKPGVARSFGLDPAPGLAAVLKGTASLEGATRPGPVPQLSVIPTAPDPDAGDLLARNLADVLRRASARYDIVIVDSPPILVGDDARTIATLCDGVLFVVAADSLAHPVSEAVGALEGLRVRVLGALANRTRVAKGLGAYGSYGHAEERSG